MKSNYNGYIFLCYQRNYFYIFELDAEITWYYHAIPGSCYRCRYASQTYNKESWMPSNKTVFSKKYCSAAHVITSEMRKLIDSLRTV